MVLAVLGCAGGASRPPVLDRDAGATDMDRPTAEDRAAPAERDPPGDDGREDRADVAEIPDGFQGPGPGTLTTAEDGLEVRGEQEGPPTIYGTGHFTRMVWRPPYVYVANSSDGVMTFELSDSGALAFRSSTRALRSKPGVGSMTSPRCTAMALHAATSTLHCHALDGGPSWYDLRTRPELAPADPRSDVAMEIRAGVRDLAMVGDTLYGAALDRGLLRASVQGDGATGVMEPSNLRGEVTAVDGDGDALVVLDRRRGLVSLRVDGAGLTERGVLPLQGPTMRVRVHGHRAVVTLGSEGAWLVDLTPATPTVIARVTPPTVSVAADFDDRVLVLGSLTGTWLYDLSAPVPRLAGYYPADYGVLDVALRGRRAVALDWRVIVTFEVHPEGRVRLPDVDNGYYLPPDTEGEVRVRNPGDEPLRVLLQESGNFPPPTPGRDRVIDRIQIAPGAVGRFRVPAARMSAGLDPGSRLIRLEVRREDDTARARSPLNITVFGVSSAPTDPPAVGRPFPVMTARAGSPAPAALPEAGRAQALHFVLPDCALQWPQIEDAVWLSRAGSPPESAPARLVLLSFGHPTEDPDPTHLLYARLWGAAALNPLPFWRYAGTFSNDPRRADAEVFENRLTTRFVGGADYTDTFFLGTDGVVRGIDRAYRGRWGLRAAAP